ncbi:MAG: sel1 repeat family protein [Clostridiales bacterium]|nr:sel1 repeat family protein [Clostridiales bacterium]
MTIKEAQKIIESLGPKTDLTEDEEFEFIEALDYMIRTTSDPRYMMELGGYYYGQRSFDLALKYYDMAAETGYEEANECLGYVWYYGRTGQKDYEKAFKYFTAAADKGNIVARYKIADMYKNGYYVNRDYDKYKEIIRDLYPRIKDARFLEEPLPEIFTRLAAIEAEEDKIYEAVDLYYRAKWFLAQRIMYNPFFGNMNIMKWLIEDLYKLIEPDPLEMDLFDLYYWLTRPCRISFRVQGRKHEVTCVEEDGENVINFEGQWYRNVDDFMKKAKIGDRLLTDMLMDLDNFVLEEGG